MQKVSENIKVSESYTHDRLQQEVYTYIWNTYPKTRGNCWHTPNEFIPDTFIQSQVKRICGDKIPNFLVGIFKMYIEKHFPRLLSERKRIGVLKGVTDLVLYYNGILLMMDIKLPGDSLSDAQKAFIAANEKQGGIFIEINTLAQAKLDIDNFFKHSLTTKR